MLQEKLANGAGVCILRRADEPAGRLVGSELVQEFEACQGGDEKTDPKIFHNLDAGAENA